MVQNLFKNLVFLSFWFNFKTGGDILCQNGEIRGVPTIEGQTGEIPPQRFGTLSIFTVLALFFRFWLPKNGQVHFIFEISKDNIISSQSLAPLNYELYSLEAFENEYFFGYNSSVMAKKGLGD